MGGRTGRIHIRGDRPAARPQRKCGGLESRGRYGGLE